MNPGKGKASNETSHKTWVKSEMWLQIESHMKVYDHLWNCLQPNCKEVFLLEWSSQLQKIGYLQHSYIFIQPTRTKSHCSSGYCVESSYHILPKMSVRFPEHSYLWSGRWRWWGGFRRLAPPSQNHPPPAPQVDSPLPWIGFSMVFFLWIFPIQSNHLKWEMPPASEVSY